MARKEPYWAAFLPSWKEKTFKRPETHIVNKEKESSETIYYQLEGCKNCTCSCKYQACPENCPIS